MAYEVRLTTAERCPTAVVAATTTWAEFPRLWRSLLDQVWAFLRGPDGTGLRTDGHNVMVYKDDVPNVEIGVQVTGTFPPHGRVVPSFLPTGPAAMTVHRGPYDRVGDAHKAVADWCAAQGVAVAGTRWEIYGDPHPDPARTETEVYRLLA